MRRWPRHLSYAPHHMPVFILLSSAHAPAPRCLSCILYACGKKIVSLSSTRLPTLFLLIFYVLLLPHNAGSYACLELLCQLLLNYSANCSSQINLIQYGVLGLAQYYRLQLARVTIPNTFPLPYPPRGHGCMLILRCPILHEVTGVC